MYTEEIYSHLYNDLIPFWMNMRDDENGGFYGFADENGVPDKESSKGVILQSRILWFFSSAYMLSKDPEVLSCADHAYRFLRDYCMDHEYGGMFWSVSSDGTPCEDMKHTYCQSFALYAFSAYYRASGNPESLDLACTLYELIESKCRDSEGYLEAFGRDFTLCENDKLSENGVMADRTMNTLLHLLESYTALLEAEYFNDVEASVLEILQIFKTHIYDSDCKICKVFFDMDYNSIIDLESYGHDIEASWLISRACDVLRDSKIKEEMMPMITGLAEGALEHGIDESDHAMNNECENGIVDSKKVWWVQAEAVTGFMNAFELTGDEDYLEASDMIWNYIRDNVIGEHGEWIENIYEDRNQTEGQALVHEWKCPYHNGRMCIEMYSRLKRCLQTAAD